MRHAHTVAGYQQPTFGNNKEQIDTITHLWSSAETAAKTHTQHTDNSRDSAYTCADIRPHLDGNEFCVQLATLTDELSHDWLQNVGIPVDEYEHMLLEWNSLCGGTSDNVEDSDEGGDGMLSLARPDELIPSPKFYYELHKAMTLLAQFKNEKKLQRKHPSAGRGHSRNSAVLQMPGNGFVQHAFHTHIWRRCIFAFKPLVDEWRVRHPRPVHVPPLPPPVLNHMQTQDLRQCIVSLCNFLESLTVAQVLLFADLCSQVAMDIMEFQSVGLDETQRRQYFLPPPQTQQRLTLRIHTFVMFPYTTNVQQHCATWEERGSVGKCNNIFCVCCSCDSDIFRISDSLTILALRHEVGKRYETNDFMKKSGGIFHTNFYADALVDKVAKTRQLLHNIDQKTQETISIAQLYQRMPYIKQHEGIDYTLYACDIACDSNVPMIETHGHANSAGMQGNLPGIPDE
jgi:hypothetical protein